MSPGFEDPIRRKPQDGPSTGTSDNNSDSGNQDSGDKPQEPPSPAPDLPSNYREDGLTEKRSNVENSKVLSDIFKEEPEEFIQPTSEQETRAAMADFYKSDSISPDRNNDRIENNEPKRG